MENIVHGIAAIIGIITYVVGFVLIMYTFIRDNPCNEHIITRVFWAAVFGVFWPIIGFFMVVAEVFKTNYDNF